MALTIYNNVNEFNQELKDNFEDYLRQSEVLENYLSKSSFEIRRRLKKRFSDQEFKDALTLSEKWQLTDYFMMLYALHPNKLIEVLESFLGREISKSEDLISLVNEVIKVIWFGEEINIRISKSESDKSTISAELKRSNTLNAQKKMDYIDKIQKNSQHDSLENGILRQSVIIMLTNNIEIFFNNLITITIKRNPGIMLSSKNTNKSFGSIKFDELSKLNDIESAKESIITSYVENEMWGGVNEWVEFLNKNIENKNESKKFKTRLESEALMKISDLFKIRNIIVHNGGKINETFINSVNDKEMRKLSIGSRYRVTPKYLEQTMTDVLKFLSDVLYKYWTMTNPKDAEIRADFFHDIGYELLAKEKYQEAQYIFKLILDNDTESIKQSLRLMTQINFAQTFKWLNDDVAAKNILSKFDFSIAPTVYLYSKSLIEDDFEKTKIYLEQLIAEDSSDRDLTVYRYCSWPIAKKFIDSIYFDDFLQKNNIDKDVLSPFTEEDDNLIHQRDDKKAKEIEKSRPMKYNGYKLIKFRNATNRNNRRNNQNDRKTNRNYKSNTRSRKQRKQRK
ncbi:hypothetical protein ACRCJ1_00075 [Aerococcus sp. L_4]